MDQDFSANVSSAGYGNYVPETQPSRPGQGHAPPAYAPPANNTNYNAPHENAQWHQRPESDQPSRRHDLVENHEGRGTKPHEHYGNHDPNSRPYHHKGENASYFYPEGEDCTDDQRHSQNSSRQHPHSHPQGHDHSEQRKHQQNQGKSGSHHHNDHEHKHKEHPEERMHDAYDRHHGDHRKKQQVNPSATKLIHRNTRNMGANQVQILIRSATEI